MKPIDERNADLLEKFTLALGVAAFVAAETLGGRLLFALAALICYSLCAYITLEKSDKLEAHDNARGSSD